MWMAVWVFWKLSAKMKSWKHIEIQPQLTIFWNKNNWKRSVIDMSKEHCNINNLTKSATRHVKLQRRSVIWPPESHDGGYERGNRRGEARSALLEAGRESVIWGSNKTVNHKHLHSETTAVVEYVILSCYSCILMCLYVLSLWFLFIFHHRRLTCMVLNSCWKGGGGPRASATKRVTVSSVNRFFILEGQVPLLGWMVQRCRAYRIA